MVRVYICFALLVLLLAPPRLHAEEHRGALFIGFEEFSDFERTTNRGTMALVSPVIMPGFPWDEVIPSWNFRGGTNEGISIDLQVTYADDVTAWYSLGKWARVPGENPRTSIPGQEDADGRVATDTLKMERPGGSVRVRITFSAGGGDGAKGLKFLGLAFSGSTVIYEPLAANQAAWGKSISVPERTQADYPEGISEWCSPTAISMMLAYWAARLERPELDYTVPEVARAVDDPGWQGTGNWPFNTAFAGWHEGIRAYVTRLSDVSELEDWIEAGIPVVVSVSYGYLKGVEEKGNGHLVICTGFTEEGDIIVNDPGRRAVRQVYKRSNLVKGWANSRGTVYLIYPERIDLPHDRFSHWFGK